VEPARPHRVVALSQLPRGTRGVVQSTELSDRDAATLGPMGLRERASIRMCRLGEPCIVEVCCRPGMCRRIGISRPVAAQVMVSIAD